MLIPTYQADEDVRKEKHISKVKYRPSHVRGSRSQSGWLSGNAVHVPD